MPSYKTHSIHGEIILPDIIKQTYIDKDDIKTFCMGPDAMIATDYHMFKYQHVNLTKDYFMTLLKLIKENKLQENSEVMAFLYGQLDHFVLDLTTHPLIYYMTENYPKAHKIDPHGLVEMWIDDYTMNKYNKDNKHYYHKVFIKDKELKELINQTYRNVYRIDNIAFKYSTGQLFMVMYDSLRNNKIIRPITKLINVGDIKYSKDLDRVIPFLNLEHDVWYNPETGEKSTNSFDDLWQRAIEVSLETINDANNFLYKDKNITNPLILNNTSYDTGLPCSAGQSLKYIKKY